MTVFIDSNVLVYARDPSDGAKRSAAREWLGQLWQLKEGRLSTQVLSEFYVTATTKLRPGLSKEVARADIEDMRVFRPLAIAPRHMTGAFWIQDRYGLNYWDALIVAAAEASGCRHLLTEDLQHNQQLGSVLVINPFLVEPDKF